MKKVLLLFTVLSFFNCTTNESLEELPEDTIIGRWIPDGFQGRVLYEFTKTKRFTFYSTNGSFQSVEELLNEGRSGNDWWLDGDKITVDLNFGNLSSRNFEFKCNSNVVEWLNDDGEMLELYYRENYNLSDCNE